MISEIEGSHYASSALRWHRNSQGVISGSVTSSTGSSFTAGTMLVPFSFLFLLFEALTSEDDARKP
ncbi:uncharacterized protein G2W53_027361 [Senna tora]|uniref:Uncharacterized protein n=1 Tax=Senna tora TaxID=362788 RepID=A0A834TJ97_9FABA|nr:uncharacterized protein G2W53_027361 [Senna tora]